MAATVIRGKTLTYFNEQLIIETCFECAMPFAMSATFRDKRLRDGKTFHCPAGHLQHYTRRKEREQELEDQLRRAKDSESFYRNQAMRNRQEANHERRSKAAYKGHLTRIKKRIANGVCPCCRRSFQNVQRHMEGQHPDFVQRIEEMKEYVGG